MAQFFIFHNSALVRFLTNINRKSTRLSNCVAFDWYATIPYLSQSSIHIFTLQLYIKFRTSTFNIYSKANECLPTIICIDLILKRYKLNEIIIYICFKISTEFLHRSRLVQLANASALYHLSYISIINLVNFSVKTLSDFVIVYFCVYLTKRVVSVGCSCIHEQ
jgi:hypothetical protein